MNVWKLTRFEDLRSYIVEFYSSHVVEPKFFVKERRS